MKRSLIKSVLKHDSQAIGGLKLCFIPLLLCLLLLLNSNCERDDICPETTPTTPRLVINFYDIANRSNPKNVFDLRIQGVGKTIPLPEYNVIKATNTISLPLRTDADKTVYQLYANYKVDDNGTPDNPNDDKVTGNEDTITITYATEAVFVSRACGYKTIFKNVSLVIEKDDDNWIQSKEALTDTNVIENEETPHFNLYY